MSGESENVSFSADYGFLSVYFRTVLGWTLPCGCSRLCMKISTFSTGRELIPTLAFYVPDAPYLGTAQL